MKETQEPKEETLSEERKFAAESPAEKTLGRRIAGIVEGWIGTRPMGLAVNGQSDQWHTLVICLMPDGKSEWIGAADGWWHLCWLALPGSAAACPALPTWVGLPASLRLGERRR